MKETAKAETPTRSTSDRAPSRPSITYQSILALQPDARNPRTHSVNGRSGGSPTASARSASPIRSWSTSAAR